MTKRVVVIGFGGHGRVVANGLRAEGFDVVAATDREPSSHRNNRLDLTVITDAELLQRYTPDDVYLALGLGTTWPTNAISRNPVVVQEFQQRKYKFIGLRHPYAWVSPDARIAETAQIHAGAVIQSNATIGEHAIVNTRASVDHDCLIGDYCHLAPGATVSGNVEFGVGCHMGTGATIIQGVRIGSASFIGAGATVTANVDDGVYVRGIPARPFRPHSPPQTEV